MMEYELFKSLVQKRIMEYMPPLYRDYVPTVRRVHKVNGHRDAFCLTPPEQGEQVAVPTIYIDDMYAMFGECEDLDRVLREAAGIFMTWTGVDISPLAEMKLEDHTDSIAAFLISRELNEELLETVPHTDFLNLSLIYRLVIRDDRDEIHSMLITNSLMEEMGMTTEELHEIAMANTPNIFPLKIIDGESRSPVIMTNDIGYSGATVMLYPEAMRGMAKRMDGDFFILPTSLHEFFAICVEDADPEDLVRLLEAGNDSITSREEQLSSMIYRYIAATGEIVKVAGYDAG